MKLIFFDESKPDPGHPHYHLGAVCIDESQLASIEAMVASIAEKAFGTAEVTRKTELLNLGRSIPAATLLTA